MSEPTPAPVANPIEAAAQMLKDADKPIEATAVEVKQGEPAADDATLGEGGKKALKAEREARTAAERQAAELRAKLDAIESANMTELERAQKAAADAKAELERVPQMVADQLRGYLQGIHGISDEDAELYLTSSDPATLLKQAAGIAARAETQAATAPKPDLTQGAQSAPALNSDALTEALARAVGAR